MQFLKCFIYLFLERGEGREKERERNVDVWLTLAHPQLGTQPTTQACALPGNRTSNPVVCRLALNPLSHTSQGLVVIFAVVVQGEACLLRFHLDWKSSIPSLSVFNHETMLNFVKSFPAFIEIIAFPPLPTSNITAVDFCMLNYPYIPWINLM